MGCQKDIAKTLVDKKADYVLALKDNHPTLHQEVVAFFNEVQAHPCEEHPVFSEETVDSGCSAPSTGSGGSSCGGQSCPLGRQLMAYHASLRAL